MREKENLTLLGNQQNNYETDYNPGLLETFVNKHPENDYFVKFNCPEFTSLCPITGQPDFANIIISYVPGERMVEFPLIHTVIMESQELSGKMWHSTVWQIMICIRRRWIIGKITLLNFVQCTKTRRVL